MGYCYTLDGKLCCDGCGTHGNGTRKRTCPHKVHYANGGSLPYCQPAALCSACYETHKPTLHAGCKAAAAQRTAEETARAARLAAGSYERKACWGSWHATVPDGMVGIVFEGTQGKAWRLVTKDAYDTQARWLEDYPHAQAWETHA